MKGGRLMFYDETAFLATILLLCPYLARYLSVFPLYIAYSSIRRYRSSTRALPFYYPCRKLYLPYFRTFSLLISSGSASSAGNIIKKRDPLKIVIERAALSLFVISP